jgi:hypothetical protein
MVADEKGFGRETKIQFLGRTSQISKIWKSVQQHQVLGDRWVGRTPSPKLEKKRIQETRHRLPGGQWADQKNRKTSSLLLGDRRASPKDKRPLQELLGDQWAGRKTPSLRKETRPVPEKKCQLLGDPNPKKDETPL